jgi:hypothetical protein
VQDRLLACIAAPPGNPSGGAGEPKREPADRAALGGCVARWAVGG